jgi:predicted Zn finger-like uncharacterized protein
MNVICTACNSRYSIADSLIPPQGARFKCRRCSAVIAIAAPVIELAPTELEVIPPPAPSLAPRQQPPSAPAVRPLAAPSFDQPSNPAFGPSGPPMSAAERPASTEFERNGPSLPAYEGQEPEEPLPPLPPESAFQQGFYAEPPPPPVERQERVAESPTGRTTLGAPESGGPASAESSFDPGVTPRFGAQPSFAEPEPAPPEPAMPPAPPKLAMPSAPPEPAMPAIFDTPRAPAAQAPAPQAPSAAVASPASPSAPAPTASTVPAVGGTPIPEGLSPEERAKHEKARRLARVLASDIAIYNRDKRERGIKDGNLVAVLGYEIKKSWEIYKERVTPEFANATPYFRDALNEMLAEGKKIF